MVKIIGEIGINYAYGENKKDFILNTEKLIQVASLAGCDFVKFQKRNPELAVPEQQKLNPKEVPWEKDPITYLQYKKDIEFSVTEYLTLRDMCKNNNINMFTSVWDIDSAKDMSELHNLGKIPSAKLTDWDLLKECRHLFEYRMLSTGMSTEEEIWKAMKILQPQFVMHTNSVYPTPISDLNLGYITHLRDAFPQCEIGYSNHYYGIQPMIASVALGIDWLECHITLNHNNWGSDQLASIEPTGLFKLVKGVRDMEMALKGNKSRTLYPGEEIKQKSLRG